MSDNNLLVLKRIKIHNANALSSPITIGFPAMSAWLGAVHALQRKLNRVPELAALKLTGVGVVSHEFDLQTYKGPGDFVHSIVGTANPVDKDGNRPAFIEEARCHLTVSLVIEYEGIERSLAEDVLLPTVERLLPSEMKFAGGDVLELQRVSLPAPNISAVMRSLMPGYVLTERRDLLIQAMQEGQEVLDALLDYLAIHHSSEQAGDGSVQWQSHRKPTDETGSKGWLVPIATGFHGLTDLGEALNQRDPDTPHRFAESVVTLGEFKMAHRIDTPNQLFWRYRYYPENDLYLCEQNVAQVMDDELDFLFK